MNCKFNTSPIHVVVLLFGTALLLIGPLNSRSFPQTEKPKIIFTDSTAEVLNEGPLLVAETPPLELTSDSSEVAPVATVEAIPEYPKFALDKWIEGQVQVKLWVTERGNVRKAILVSSTKSIFNRPALKAAVMWKFRPASRNGEPIPVWVFIPFRFSIQR